MIIFYRDEGGIVAEDLGGHDEMEIDFCDGMVYFESSEIGEDGFFITKEVPVSAIVRISE